MKNLDLRDKIEELNSQKEMYIALFERAYGDYEANKYSVNTVLSRKYTKKIEGLNAEICSLTDKLDSIERNNKKEELQQAKNISISTKISYLNQKRKELVAVMSLVTTLAVGMFINQKYNDYKDYEKEVKFIDSNFKFERDNDINYENDNFIIYEEKFLNIKGKDIVFYRECDIDKIFVKSLNEGYSVKTTSKVLKNIYPFNIYWNELVDQCADEFENYSDSKVYDLSKMN